MEDRTIQKPGDDLKSAKVYDSWSPYGLPCFTSFPNGQSITYPTILVSHFRISLCEIMSSLGSIVYGYPLYPYSIAIVNFAFRYGIPSISRESLHTAIEQTTSELFDWKGRLPASLNVDPDDHSTLFAPHVLLLQ